MTTATSTSVPTSRPLAREQGLVLASLLVLAAAGWAVLVWQRTMMDEEMGLTMGMGVVLFIALWVAMMVAIMFPTAAPMILTFARVHRTKRERGQSFVPTWVFVSAYLLVWTLSGVAAYGVALGLEAFADSSIWIMDNAPRLGGAVRAVEGRLGLRRSGHVRNPSGSGLRLPDGSAVRPDQPTSVRSLAGRRPV